MQDFSNPTHRQLIQQSLLSQQDRDSNLLKSESIALPIPALSKSASFVDSSSYPIDVPHSPLLGSCSSPYLISYSPRREVSLKTPSPLPPDVTRSQPRKIARGNTLPIFRGNWPRKRQVKVKSGGIERQIGGGGFGKDLDVGDTRSVVYTKVCDLPQVRIADDSIINAKPSSNHATSSVRSNVRIRGEEEGTAESLQVEPDVDHVIAPLNVGATTLIVQSDIIGETDTSVMELGRRFIKSDNFQTSRDGPKTQNPSLKRWTENIRLRLSSGRMKRKSKRFEPVVAGGTFKLPLLPHEQGGNGEERGEMRSRAMSVPGKDRDEGARGTMKGSYVVVKIKDPGPLGFLSDNYVKKLEDNFRLNHMFGSLSGDVNEGMVEAVRQAQVHAYSTCVYT